MAILDFLTRPVTFLGSGKGSQATVVPGVVAKAGAGSVRGAASAKPRAAATTSGRPAANVTPIRAAAATVATSASITYYKSTSDLPAYTEVASLGGKRFEVGLRAQEAIAVLQLAEANDLYCVIATKETFGSASYKGMLARIADAGCRVRRCGTADGALIHRVNKASVDVAFSDERDKRIVLDIDKLTQDALDQDASDIHIEKRAGSAKVKMRINGRLELHSDSWDPDYVDRFARALHTLADDDSKAQTFTEDAQMAVSRRLQPSGAQVKLRVQVAPAYPDGGLDIVIRVLRVGMTAKIKQLIELGYEPEQIEMLEYMQAAPGGLTVIAGTTGCGKSTTLQTVMTNIQRDNPGHKLISIEDPPEYVLPGVTQIPVARRRDQSGENLFAQAMRATLRMDPDVLMIGEIRDKESAELTVHTVQSGHKALGTLHTESALGVVARLLSMGIQRDVLAGRRFLTGLIYQTLVPLLCPHCKLDYDPTSTAISKALHDRIRRVTRAGDTIFVEAPGGCSHCNHRGIIGRTVCAEMVIPTPQILEHIRKGDMAAAYKSWREQLHSNGPDLMTGATALEHGILKMRRGQVSPVDVEHALGLLFDFTLERNAAAKEVGMLLSFNN
jgi:type II secretory ATPase GspE/PulE/Tfp pilus assembly ATPase PilB-like protein